jgi:branched-chain amino acid transport system substrate-binding protein
MMTTRFGLSRSWIALGACALLPLGSCRRGETAKPIEGQVAIGVGALPGRPGYESMVRGVQMAVERLNEAGAVRFRLRTPDRGSTSAVQVAQQLRDDPAVIAVVGHPESGNTIETIPVYADAEHIGENGVVAISPTATSPRLSGISPWFFRVAPSDAEAARYVARWVVDSLHATRAAVIFRNDSYGRDWSSTFSETFVKSGATVVTRDPYLAGMTEWDAYAQLLARLKPDVLLFPGDAADAIDMLRAIHTAGVKVAFIGGDGTAAMRDSSEAAGTRYVTFFRPDAVTSEEGRTFLRRFQEKFKQEPDMFAAMSYDAALAIGRTVIAGARTRPSLRHALELLGTKSSPAIEGVAGPLSFERNHDIAKRGVVITAVSSSGIAGSGVAH